jgi:hypothetical protein
MNTTPATIAPPADRLPQVHRTKEQRELDAIQAARAARERIRPRRLDPRQQYLVMLENLRVTITTAGPWASIAAFCDDSGIDKFNLSKCWPKESKPGRPPLTEDERYPEKEMSVGLYSRILLALGLFDNCEVSDEQLLSPDPVRSFITYNTSAIMRSLIALQELSK